MIGSFLNFWQKLQAKHFSLWVQSSQNGLLLGEQSKAPDFVTPCFLLVQAFDIFRMLLGAVFYPGCLLAVVWLISWKIYCHGGVWELQGQSLGLFASFSEGGELFVRRLSG